MSSKIDDDELERQAVAEIMQEAKRGAERAKEMGSLGWVKPQVSTNKNFLRNTLVSTLRHPYGSKKKRDFQPKYKGQHSDSKYQKYVHKYDGRYQQNQGEFKGKHKPGSGGMDSEMLEEEDAKLKEDGAIDQRLAPPEGGYVYDAYEYSYQAPKANHDKQRHEKKDKDSGHKSQRKKSDRKTSETKTGASRAKELSWSESSILEDGEKLKEDGAIDQRLQPPEGGYFYDAYDYSYQASLEPKPKESNNHRTHRSKHSSHKSGAERQSAGNHSSERRSKRRHSDGSKDGQDSHKRKKSKKKHKHKKKHKKGH